MIRVIQEQRKRVRCSRKSRFKACVIARKDYKYGMQMITSSIISHEAYKIYKGYKFFSVQLLLKNRRKLQWFGDRYNKFYNFYHKLYPENLRVDLEKKFEKKQINSISMVLRI